MRAGQAGLLAAAIAVLAALGWIVDQRLTVGTDLRLFMPSPRTGAERLVLEEIGEGPASRMLLLAIRGGDPGATAATSRRLAQALRLARASWLEHELSSGRAPPMNLTGSRRWPCAAVALPIPTACCKP